MPHGTTSVPQDDRRTVARGDRFGILRLAAATIILIVWHPLFGQQTATDRDALYRSAAELSRRVGGTVTPHWMADGSSFWYVERAGPKLWFGRSIRRPTRASLSLTFRDFARPSRRRRVQSPPGVVFPFGTSSWMKMKVRSAFRSTMWSFGWTSIHTAWVEQPLRSCMPVPCDNLRSSAAT